MCMVECMARGVGVGIILCMLVLLSIAYINNNGSLTYRLSEKQNMKKNIYANDVDSEFYDVDVMNSLINGTVLLEGESRVLLQNVDITADSIIVATDNVSLWIKSSMAENLNILASDGAKVYIENLSTYSGFIYATDHSEVYINSIYGATYINVFAYGTATIYVTGEVANYTIFNLKEHSCLFGHDIVAESSWAVNFRLYDYAQINVSHIENTGIDDIWLYNNSIAYVSCSNISEIFMYDMSAIYVYNSKIDSFFIESGEWFYIDDSYVGSMENKFVGSNGRIESSVVSWLNLMTKSTVDIIYSEIGYMQFMNVFNDSLVINSSGWFYESSYVNYNNISSHANITYNMTSSFIMVVNSPLLSINVNMSVDSIVAMSVSKIDISLANIMVGWKLYFLDTYISLNLVNINSSSIFKFPEFYIINSSGVINNSYIKDLSKLYVENSKIKLISSTIECTMPLSTSYVHIARSYVGLNSSMIVGNTYIEDILLEDGNFSMVNGVVSVSSGNMIYGVEKISESGITGYVGVGTINVSRSFMEIRDTTFNSFPPLSVMAVYTCIYASNSSILLNNTYSNLSMSVYLNLTMVNNSKIKIYSSNITSLSVQYGLAEAVGTNISTIDLIEAKLNISSSNIDTIYAFNNSFIYMSKSALTGNLNVQSEEEELTPYIYADIKIEYSNVSDICFLGFGDVKIVNSSIGNVFSLFAEVDIINSTVGSASKMYQIITSGYVEIVNNVIQYGTYQVLLNISNSYITHMMEGIVFAGSDLFLNLTDTSYFALVTFGKNINVSLDKSAINMAAIIATNIIISDSLIDTSSMPGMSIFFTASRVDIYNTSIYSGGAVYISPYGPPTGNITGYVGIDNSKIAGECLHIGDSELNMSGADLMGLNNVSLIFVSFEISNTNVSNLYVENAEGQLTNLKAHLMGINDNSNVFVTNSDMNVTIMRFWQICGPLYLGEEAIDFNFTRNMYLDVYDSKINFAYTNFYHIDSFLRVYFDNDTITGSYTTKTSYVNTNLGEYQIALFEVSGRGKATIMNYQDMKAIFGLWVNVYADYESPSIVPLNESYIEYEYGLEYNLSYELHDETPTYYYVLLNGSEVESGEYYDGYILTVSLPDIIPRDGVYNLSIKAVDSEGRASSVTTIINVFPSEPPEIYVSPNDTYNLTIGENVTLVWKARDRNPGMYYIYLNGTQIKTGSWVSDQEIRYVFNASESGAYNITIAFSDAIGNQRVDSVIIFVEEIQTTTTTTTTQEMPIPPEIAITIVGVAIAVIVVAIIVLRKKG